MYQPLITFCPHPAIFTQVLCIFAFDRKKCAGPIVGMYMRQESYSDTIISSIDNRTHAEVSPGYAHG